MEILNPILSVPFSSSGKDRNGMDWIRVDAKKIVYALFSNVGASARKNVAIRVEKRQINLLYRLFVR